MDFCLGTVQLGMRYGIQNSERPSPSEVVDILSAALNVGIHYFDTAAAYGEAEQVLGTFAAENLEQAKHMNIISKLRPEAFEDAPCEKWKTIAIQQAKESAKRVRTTQLTAYLFHKASFIFDTTAVEALDVVRKEGIAKRIGVSVYSPKEALKALEYPQIGIIQVPYNVFDQRLDQCGFFDMAKKQGVQIFARSSLLQGLLAMQPSRLPRHMDFAKPYLLKFLSICDDYCLSPLQAAIGYVASHPHIDYVVFGVDNTRQLFEYSAVLREKLPSQVRDTLADVFHEVDEKLVNPSFWS